MLVRIGQVENLVSTKYSKLNVLRVAYGNFFYRSSLLVNNVYKTLSNGTCNFSSGITFTRYVNVCVLDKNNNGFVSNDGLLKTHYELFKPYQGSNLGKSSNPQSFSRRSSSLTSIVAILTILCIVALLSNFVTVLTY